MTELEFALDMAPPSNFISFSNLNISTTSTDPRTIGIDLKSISIHNVDLDTEKLDEAPK